MSVRIVSEVWGGDYEVGTMLTLLAMADYAREDGLCWPSVSQLARKTRQSDRNVRRCLRELEMAGILSVERSPFGHTARRYRIQREVVRARQAAARSTPGGTQTAKAEE